MWQECLEKYFWGEGGFGFCYEYALLHYRQWRNQKFAEIQGGKYRGGPGGEFLNRRS